MLLKILFSNYSECTAARDVSVLMPTYGAKGCTVADSRVFSNSQRQYALNVGSNDLTRLNHVELQFARLVTVEDFNALGGWVSADPAATTLIKITSSTGNAPSLLLRKVARLSRPNALGIGKRLVRATKPWLRTR